MRTDALAIGFANALAIVLAIALGWKESEIATALWFQSATAASIALLRAIQVRRARPGPGFGGVVGMAVFAAVLHAFALAALMAMRMFVFDAGVALCVAAFIVAEFFLHRRKPAPETAETSLGFAGLRVMMILAVIGVARQFSWSTYQLVALLVCKTAADLVIFLGEQSVLGRERVAFKAAFATIAILAALLLVGHLAYVAPEERRANAQRFFFVEPVDGLRQIKATSITRGTLKGSGAGVAIAGSKHRGLGTTAWEVSVDGVVRGSAAEGGYAIRWTPRHLGAHVHWDCAIEPKQEFPKACERSYRDGSFRMNPND